MADINWLTAIDQGFRDFMVTLAQVLTFAVPYRIAHHYTRGSQRAPRALYLRGFVAALVVAIVLAASGLTPPVAADSGYQLVDENWTAPPFAANAIRLALAFTLVLAGIRRAISTPGQSPAAVKLLP